MLSRLSTRVLCALLVMICNAALAQDVRLVSKDSEIVLEGDLLSYDGEHFRIDTIYGPLTVSAAGVICKGARCPAPGPYVPTIRISGDGFMARLLLPKLIEDFAKQNGFETTQTQVSGDRTTVQVTQGAPIGRFEIHATSNEEGYVDLITEGADIALVTRLPKDAELSMSASSSAGDLLSGRRAHVLAVDTISVLGSVEIQKQGLTLRNFLSLINDTGSTDGPVLYALNEGPRLLDGLLFSAARSAAQRLSVSDLSTTLASDTRAVAVVRQSAGVDGATVQLTDACGVLPRRNAFNVHTGDDPLAVRMMAYSAPRRLPKVGRSFLTYLGSKPAQAIVAGFGYSPPAIVQTDFGALGHRLARVISGVENTSEISDLKRFTESMSQRTRLSATFRFRDGSTELDMVSRDLIRRFAESDYADQSLILAGFSTLGPQSFKTSQDLIAKVQRELSRYGIDDTRAFPMGNVMPVLCDDSALGAFMNRRVEIWIDEN